MERKPSPKTSCRKNLLLKTPYDIMTITPPDSVGINRLGGAIAIIGEERPKRR